MTGEYQKKSGHPAIRAGLTRNDVVAENQRQAEENLQLAVESRDVNGIVAAFTIFAGLPNGKSAWPILYDLGAMLESGKPTKDILETLKKIRSN